MSPILAFLRDLRGLPFAALRRMIALMFRAAPRESILVFVLNLLIGVVSPLLLVLGSMGVWPKRARISSSWPRADATMSSLLARRAAMQIRPA